MELSKAPSGAHPKTWSFSGPHFGAILVRFGAPTWAQKSSKIAPRRLQDGLGNRFFASSLQNVNFYEILGIPTRKRLPGPQDEAPNRPRSAQDDPKTVLDADFEHLKHCIKFGLVLGPILDQFGVPKGSLGAPFSGPKSSQNRSETEAL